jgi:hypothetical protein
MKDREDRRRALAEAAEPKRRGIIKNRYDINDYGSTAPHIRHIGLIKKRRR